MTVIAAWWQYEQLTPVQRAVRETLEEGGSATSVLAVLGITGGLILLVYLLTNREARAASPRRVNNPKALFRDLLPKLSLSAPQRKLLESMAKELDLPHPTTMLLSPVLFDAYKTKWCERRRSGTGRASAGKHDNTDRTLARIRTLLFAG